MADYDIARHSRRVHVIAGMIIKTTYSYGCKFLKWIIRLKFEIVCVGIVGAGTVTGFSVAGAFGVGAAVWYLKKVRAKAPVTCGVQTNENRLF